MKSVCWLLTCFAVLAAIVSAGNPAQAADPIKVGIVDSYSGARSTYANDVLDGFKLAVDATNAKGGVLGRNLTFVTRDDKFKVDLGLSAAEELIMREKVGLLTGTVNSAVTLAASHICKKEKVPFLATCAKSGRILWAKGLLVESFLMAQARTGWRSCSRRPTRRGLWDLLSARWLRPFWLLQWV